jgi:hypothetical protein
VTLADTGGPDNQKCRERYRRQPSAAARPPHWDRDKMIEYRALAQPNRQR